ncbi:tetratricopeptide repeat protein [Candidatus Marinimicrobia bacterium MT.SAG.2]|nr:tetratricopeptide repeat protein [Candidatus Marinimicrobia bacterium MT.SAG.2]
MLTDNEIRSAAEDTLEFNAFAETLGEIIITSEPPLTVGVYGEWGSGKTSLMRLTQEVLEKQKKKKIKTSWFNAWKYDKAHDLRVALINTILKEISKDKKTSKTLKSKSKKLLKRVNLSGLGMSAVSIIGTLLAPQLAFIPALTKLLTNDKTSPADLARLIPKNILKEDGGQKTLELIGEFEEEYKNIIKSYVGKNGILVVFIDDLDRCLPEKTIDILEAIKLFLHVPHSVFVIGASREIIVKGIMRKYKVEPDDSEKKIDEWGADYLEKIIQIPFRLPPLRTDLIANTFIEKLDVSEEIKKHKNILAQVRKNPRTIKRLLNSFELQMILAEKRGLAIEESILAKLVVLEFKWALFHKNLIDLFGVSDGKINLIEIADFEESKRDERLKDLQGIEQYYNDTSLMDFIKEEPSLIEANLGDYVYLAGTTKEETKKESKDASYYFNMGYASSEKGDLDKAIEYYSDAIMLNPQYSKAYNNRGDTHDKKGEIDKAIEDFNKAIELDPEYARAYYNRGVVYDEKGQYGRAIKDYDKAIELNPDYFKAYYNRGLVYAKKEEFDKAIEDCNKAIELEPGFANAYDSRAFSYHGKGEYDKAMEDYSQSIKLDPGDELAYDNIIELLNEVLEKKIHFPDKWDSSNVKARIMSSDLVKKKKDKITTFLKKLNV